ncbi:MAG TPA: NrpR regulatory domain-containing protein [Dehalococcoidales bacterium]|nr:NrpR regulatory domain-containing protein [Dehalococcoidales bacterium]
MGFETQNVERKMLAILKVLSDSQESVGARVISRRLKDYGVELGERAVRYHLKLMDERGLTRLLGRRDGRVLTEQGIEEVRTALVKDKVGYAISRIELLAFRTDFNPQNRTGSVPVNISLFPKGQFQKALQAMRPAFAREICVSDLVAIAQEGERLGDLVVPNGKVGLATVCSIVFNGTSLKAGVPMASGFSGILQVRNNKPIRFVELIQYAGCSLDPSEVFIRARMTSVTQVIRTGEGKILATYREIPALCRPIVEDVVAKMREAGLGGVLVMGNASETVCEVPVELNRIGLILVNGLNPVAAAMEAGLDVENQGMSTVMDYQQLIKFQEL